MSDREMAQEVRQVLNMLADARLITLNENTAEVAHEALIREWPTLREWLNQDREGLQLHRRVTEAAHEWELLDRDPGVLFRSTQLAQARDWTALHPSTLNAGEKSFLEASNSLEQNEIAEREAQQRRELEAAKKLAETERQSASRMRIRNRVITIVGVVALVLAVLASVFGVQSNQNALQAETNLTLADQQRAAALNAQSTAVGESQIRATQQALAESNFNRAEAQRVAAEAKGLLLQNGNAEAIALLALRSLNTQYTPQGDEALVAASLLDYPIRAFLGHSNRVKAVDFSPDGRYILTGSSDSTVRLWDRQTGQQIRQFSGDMQDVNTAVFSPDSRFILTGSRFDHTVRLWDVETGEELRRFSEGNAAVFSLDGQRIFVHSEEGYGSMMIDLKSGEILHTIPAPQTYRRVESTGYSPDGTLYVDTPPDEGIVYIREVQSGREILRVPPFTENFAVSSDNHYLALPDNLGNISLWDLRTGELFQTLKSESRDISITFSPDDRLLATGSDDGIIRIWDVQTGEQIRYLRGHTLTARIVRFSPDGRFLMSGGFDHRALLWELTSSPAPLYLQEENHGLFTSAFSRNGAYIAAGREDGSVFVWDARTGEMIWKFQAGNETVLFAAFAPDNSLLVTDSDQIRIWDMEDGTMLREFNLNLGPDQRFNSFDVSSEHILAAYDGTDDWTGGVIAWDLQTGAEVRRFTSPIGAQSVLVSLDEKLLATYTIADYQARIFDMATGEEIHAFPVENNTGSPLGFSPDSQRLFTGGNLRSAVWDLNSGKQLYEIVGPTSVTETNAFSHDSGYILTGSADNTIRIWESATGREVRRITMPFDALPTIFSENDDSLFVHGFDGRIYILHTRVENAMEDLCSRLIRDFTPEEREQYEIKDSAPTCPPKP
jgi:WD40 repeat protein